VIELVAATASATGSISIQVGAPRPRVRFMDVPILRSPLFPAFICVMMTFRPLSALRDAAHAVLSRGIRTPCAAANSPHQALPPLSSHPPHSHSPPPSSCPLLTLVSRYHALVAGDPLTPLRVQATSLAATRPPSPTPTPPRRPRPTRRRSSTTTSRPARSQRRSPRRTRTRRTPAT
jgi:hypothetical protein